jgi:hypothetical protein
MATEIGRYTALDDYNRHMAELKEKIAALSSGRSEVFAAPNFISDTMHAVQSQLDGKYYDSKAALRATYKAAGVVELGNDSSVMNPAPRAAFKVDGAAVRESVDKAFTRAGLGA